MYQRTGVPPLRVSSCLAVIANPLAKPILHSIAPSPVLLANHFFSVAFYAIWVMFTHPRAVYPSPRTSDAKPTVARARIDEYPKLFLKSFHVVRPAYRTCYRLLMSLGVALDCVFGIWAAGME
jgi:hypothetical protein